MEGIMKTSVYDCSILELDRHHSPRKGDISVVENRLTVPFDTKRVYYLYDVPGGVERGGHAHKALEQLIVAVSGSFTVVLDDGKVKRSFVLNRPYMGLYVTPGIWRVLDDFSSGSVCLVLASEKYDPDDYIRDYDEFIQYKSEEK
jgi:dTDP-4-dehydrorhamnose 3,5-epimerase-like enzyme